MVSAVCSIAGWGCITLFVLAALLLTYCRPPKRSTPEYKGLQGWWYVGAIGVLLILGGAL